MLTAKRVLRALKRPGRYGDGFGLYLHVHPKRPSKRQSSASWVLRYQRNGREHMLGLGPQHTVTLKEARERAKAARLQLLDGVDPIKQKATDREARRVAAGRSLSFADASKGYFAQHEAKWKSRKHRAEFQSTFQSYVYPKIGSLPVAAIDTGEVLRCLEPIWNDKTVTANRLRGRIEAVLNYATVRGYRTGPNPARWRGHLSNVLPARSQIAKVEHHAALPFTELPEFLAALRSRDGSAARALEFAILTAARSGEVIGATWDEIDLKNKVWTVPARRIKGGREHRVPLSARAIELLNEVHRESDNPHVFIGSRANSGLSKMAMTMVLQRMQRDDITVHGFRSTFMDWSHERTTFPKVVIDMALAHVIGDKVEAAYRRGDLFQKRAALMTEWGKYCTAAPVKEGEVVPLRGRL